MNIKQFIPDCNCKYGAPMGRRTWGVLEHDEEMKLYLFHVPLDSGGYDRGGAYWGSGQKLYCATDKPSDDCTYYQFVRANSRKEAAELLGIPNYRLRRRW